MPLPLLLYVIWLALSALGGVALLLGARRLSRPILPPQRERAVPWDGFDVLAITAILTPILLPSFAIALLDLLHFFPLFYGASLEEGGLSLRVTLWARVVAFPFQILGFLTWIFRGRIRLYQLGLTTARWGKDVIVGYLGFVLVTPVVFAVLMGVSLLPTEKHPLVEASRESLSFIEWVLLFIVPTVVAAVTEELMFRGILQRWFQYRPQGPPLAMLLALIVSLYLREKDLAAAVSAESLAAATPALTRGLAPAAFVLLMVPGYLFAPGLLHRWIPRRQAALSVYATSLLFAMVHSAVWPSPIPLFVLSLALGYLAYRTQSVIPSITLHALFNLVSCIAMVFLPADDQEKGKEATSALRRSPPASSSSMVPGASLPRRI